jgi:SAM-dependent methyltransferase
MKDEALRFLVCPACKAGLSLAERHREGNEIMQGSLSCSACPAAYPIREGIPRFVAEGSYASSFGLQWNWFPTVQLDSFNGRKESRTALLETTGWQEADYRDRLVLDAGVGSGRFAEVVADQGGEIVGVDITRAVDAAFANIGRRERVHLIQADLFRMPFREGTFDLAYSIGVLHHTPDTRAAFERVAAVVKPDGGLAVYLYAAYGLRLAHACSDLLRVVTTRLPPSLMFWLSALSVPLRPVCRLPILGNLLRTLLPVSSHPDWRWRWLETFDWYTPRYQWKVLYPEVVRWFRACGFTDITLFDDPIRVRGVRTPSRAASRAA